ncbi:RNA polymerase II-binding domain-containing protein [Aspergillus candidus]|uniref:CID domain-containing protein n=1 Tax=Aspergillus candidus TaxID=41067 RepID=A0A2I2FNX2_ASPCN|nr:hypothetical protein BDW47DRAFT_98299 [Aspergillus candidus]PLB42337.1 hypothetical protein BDW47DRAFT_98299 [Aspergillus candidus]
MASHQLAIAKASFSAGLLRPDPTSVPRDEIVAFHTALDRALSHCTPANIQTCKTWLLNLVVSSSNRVGGLAKYLVALSGSLDDSEKPGGGRPRPSGKRKRLHILYLLNDLFHHTKFHLDSTASFSTLSGSIQPFIVELLGYAASYDRAKNPKHHRRLDELLDIWEQNGYYGSDYVNKLREVVKNSALSGPVKASVDVETSNLDFAKKQPGKDAPFVMPATHGDSSTPFYDLPAGNLVPHIIPNVTVPLRPDSIKPLQFLAGPADEKLVTALKVFLSDAESIYDARKPEPKEDQVVDIDELGQTVIRDGSTGDIVAGSTYYGWSRGFCQEMKKRDTSSSFRSRSRSRSRSETPRRRRYSDSLASDDSRWSRSRSRSRTPPRRQDHYDSRSRSPSGRGSGSRERSYSPQPPAPRSVPPPLPQQPPFPHTQQHPHGYAPPHFPPPPPPQMHFPPPAGSPPTGYPPAIPPGLPPPPPPPNYQGPWPPPPPIPGYGGGPGGGGPSAFPPPFPAQGAQFPPMHMGGSGQQMPPGQYHFPPPHAGRGWGQYGYPPAGRGWR